MDLLKPFRTLNAQLSDSAPQAERRAQQITPWGPWGTQYQSSAGVNVNQDSALALMAVFGCVNLISDTIATLPRHAYRDNGGRTEEVAVTPAWWDQPNASTDMVDLITQTLSSLLLDGNAYWALGIDRNNLTNQIVALDPTMVEVRQRQRSPEEALAGVGNVVEYFVNGNQFRGRLLHIKGLTRPGALKGLSPVEAARQSIGLGLATQQFAAEFYSNGINPSGAVTTDADLTQTQATDLARQIEAAHGGSGKRHRPMILDNGAKWTQLSITPEQAQFLATREFQAGEICAQLFLVDPSMLGIAINRGQNLTYANLEQRGIHLVQYTLMRWLIRLERAFTLLLPKPQYMKFNVDAITRADLLTRYQAHRIALGPNTPFETVNEVRDLEEMEPLPNGDTLSTPAPTLAPFPSPNGNGNGQPVGATQ